MLRFQPVDRDGHLGAGCKNILRVVEDPNAVWRAVATESPGPGV